MIDVVSVIRKLAATNSRNEKEEILRDAFLSDHREFFIGARLAYDKLVSFGVARAAEISEDDPDCENPGTFTFDDFIVLTNKLKKRQLTGHAARDAINDAASNCNGPTWNEFYRRVILKDMKIGCDESTINKVLTKLIKHVPEAADWLIPVFECQLAHDGENESHKKKIKGRKFFDVKLDGVRTLALLNKEANSVTLFTRNGQPILTCPEVRQCLENILEKIPGSLVLDGELMSPKGFQHLMTLLKNPDRDTSMVKLAMFDIIPLEDFRLGLCKIPLWKRHQNLALLETSGILQQAGGQAYVVPKKEINLGTDEGQIAFKEFNREALDLDYEGIMVKDPESPYEAKRSASWLKIKPYIDVSLEIIAVEEGKPDGKYVGKLGAFVCRGIDDGKLIQTNVGSGFSDEQRVEFWNDRDKLL
jgi:DNA ligase-1